MGKTTNLRVLDISNSCQVRDHGFTYVARLTNLQKLIMRNMTVTDCSPVAALTRLTHLDMSGCTQLIPKTFAIPRLTNIQEISVNRTLMSTLKWVKNFIHLRKLSIASTKITLLTPLRYLYQLRYLDMSRCSAVLPKEFSKLSVLTQLQNLYLYGTRIRSLEKLASLIHLPKSVLKAPFFSYGAPRSARLKLKNKIPSVLQSL